MNLKTTILLVLLTGAGIGGWVWWSLRKADETTASSTLEFFQTKLSADKLTHIEVSRLPPVQEMPQIAARTIGLLSQPAGQGVVLTAMTLHPRSAQTLFVLEKTGDEWHLPGNWPVRPQETDQLLAVLTTLRTRFAPLPLTEDAALKPYGLDDDPLTIQVAIGAKTHTLRFGEEPDDGNRFTRSSFVRLDKEPEVIRLGPGVFAALNRSLDYFRQRRLFQIERVAKEEDSKDKVEQLSATEVEVTTDKAKFVLHKKDKDWLLKEAFTRKDKDWLHAASNDRIDPARRDALLRAFPDLWAEAFVEMKTLDDCGLKAPAFVITVTRPSGAKTKLLVGKVSRPRETKEEYRFAKLENNDQFFEIKTDKLGDITLAVDALRDPQLARFKADDVKRLEIRHGKQTLVFAKVKEDDKDKDSTKEKWRLEKPNQDDIEAKQVEDFLEKLAGLQARDDAVLDKVDLKTVGLDKPAGQIKITVEEGKDAKKKTREILLRLGQKEKDNDKLYVTVDDWPRVNEVGAELWKLAQRSELAYRPRELWKLDRDAITRITIQADGKPYHLDRGDKAWKIAGPIDAEATGPEPDALVEELAHLKAERFETRDTKDLAKYGLDKPAFKISITAKDKKPRTLDIGKRDDSKEGGRFAWLEGGAAIFVLSEKLTANFRADPLDFLDKNLVSFDPGQIERIRYQGAAPFALEKKKGQWQVVDSPAPAFSVDKDVMESVLKPWQKLRAEKFAAVGPKIAWDQFGLVKPTTSIVLTLSTGGADKPKEHVVEIGSEVKDGGRYARFDKKDAVVVLHGFLAEQLVRAYVDFVDPRVLRPFDPDAVTLIERKMLGADVELARREDSWQIVKPSLRDADNLTIFDLLRRTSGLQAKRIAAFPAKDLQAYGLDKPAAIVTLILDFDGNTKKHAIKVGNLTNDKAKGEKDERFAMVDDKPMVIVLSAELSRHLIAPALYFADRNLASFSSVDRAELTHGARKLSFNRADAAWQITQPVTGEAEHTALEDLIRGLQRLRADEIVADKGADLKKYGLDQPAAQWRFKIGDDEQLHLLVGAAENAEPGARRFAKLGTKNTVFLLNSKLSARVLGEFRSKKVWPPFDVAKVEELTVTGPDGSFTLKKKDKEWSVVGQAKAMVKANVVADTLEMLSTLHAHHYVRDAKADLKPFGLDKPAWKLEVPTPMGKRELWIGGREDKSKRPYATVPGAGAVFVLDEIDNIILARPLSAYVEAEKKGKDK